MTSIGPNIHATSDGSAGDEDKEGTMATTTHDSDLARDGLCVCKACVDAQIQEHEGRYMIARWSTRQQQWTSHDLLKWARFQGYCYSYAHTLRALVNFGIRTYPTRARARAAVRAEDSIERRYAGRDHSLMEWLADKEDK